MGTAKQKSKQSSFRPFLYLLLTNLTLVILVDLCLVSINNNSILITFDKLKERSCELQVTEFLKAMSINDLEKVSKYLTTNNMYFNLLEINSDIFTNPFCDHYFTFKDPIALYFNDNKSYGIVHSTINCKQNSRRFYFIIVLEEGSYKIASWRIFEEQFKSCLLNGSFIETYNLLGGEAQFGDIIDFYVGLSDENNLQGVYQYLKEHFEEECTYNEFRSKIGLY